MYNAGGSSLFRTSSRTAARIKISGGENLQLFINRQSGLNSSFTVITEKFVFIRQSKYLLKRGLAQAALNNINKALELENQSDCCELLTIRSLCYLQLEYWQVI